MTTATTANTIYYPIYTRAATATSTLYAGTYVSQTGASSDYVRQAMMQRYQAMMDQALAAQQAQRAMAQPNAAAQWRLQEVIAQRRRATADAQQRARALLLRHLSPEQRESLLANKFFVVVGGRTRNRYRVDDDGHVVGNVALLDAQGRATYRLCAHCDTRQVPMGDQLLAQKLMLEGDEDQFIRLANRHAA